ncbi:MAG: hypothetical protein ACR2HX_13025 [Pyrinomonadaceae bacterium]
MMTTIGKDASFTTMPTLVKKPTRLFPKLLVAACYEIHALG